jgi:hypothetical protein
MANEKYTPGPWKSRGHGQTVYVGKGVISGEPGEGLEPIVISPHVVRVYQDQDEQNRRCTQFIATCNGATCPNEANARLIAAAPDMYEACKCAETVLILLSEEVSRLGLRAENVLPRLRTAIKKAETGE